MAKRRKSKRRSSGRRRRVGAIPKMDLQALGLGIAGAIVASKLQTMLAKDPTKETMVKIAPFIGLAAGLALPMFIKNPMLKTAAAGMAIFGGVAALKKLAPGLIGNFAMIPIISSTSNKYRQLPQQNPVLNGVGFPLPNTSVYKDSMSVINGFPGGNSSGSGASAAY